MLRLLLAQFLPVLSFYAMLVFLKNFDKIGHST